MLDRLIHTKVWMSDRRTGFCRGKLRAVDTEEGGRWIMGLGAENRTERWRPHR